MQPSRTSFMRRRTRRNGRGPPIVSSAGCTSNARHLLSCVSTIAFRKSVSSCWPLAVWREARFCFVVVAADAIKVRSPLPSCLAALLSDNEDFSAATSSILFLVQAASFMRSRSAFVHGIWVCLQYVVVGPTDVSRSHGVAFLMPYLCWGVAA